MHFYRFRFISVVVIVGCLAVATGWQTMIAPGIARAGAVEQQNLVDSARITLRGYMVDENMDMFREQVKTARAILIIPSMVKGGFIVGGSGGSGVMLVKDDRTGAWSHPGFYTLGAVSFGLQIGGEAAEVIMVIRTRKAVDRLYATNAKLGGDVSVAAGPVGQGAKANVLADVISYTRSKGVYLGASLEGSVVKIRDQWNADYYGQPVRPIDIFVRREVSNPGAVELVEAVAAATSR